MKPEDKKEIEKLISKFHVAVSAHGGGVRLAAVRKNCLELELLGACAGCALADLSYNTILKGLIRKKFPKVEIKFKKSKTQNYAKF